VQWRSAGKGEWWVRPRWQSPRGGNMGGEINILNKKLISTRNKFSIIELSNTKFNK
jgi:hypothetical protein